MKDIKSLYLAAKLGRDKQSMNDYTEAVRSILESKPIDFLSNLEYIITLNMNLPRLDDFVEKYGISVAAYDPIMECLESCVRKCEERNLDSSLYKEYIEKFEAFRNDNIHCFAMYEYYSDEDFGREYLEAYYGIKDGKIGSQCPQQLVLDFGEAAIPDALLISSRHGAENLNFVADWLLEKCDCLTSSLDYQFLVESSKDAYRSVYHSDDDLRIYTEKSAETIIDEMNKRNQQVLTEATIHVDPDAVYEYSEEEIRAIQDMIAFKEYMVTVVNPDEAVKLQSEIYSLYEELDGITDLDGNEYISEMSDDLKKTAIKEIKTKLSGLAREIKSKYAKDIRKEFKDQNKGKFFNRLLVPSISCAYGNKKGSFFTQLFMKSKIDKHILSVDNEGKALSNFFLFVSFTIEASAKIPKMDLNMYYSLFNKYAGMHFKPLVDDGKIIPMNSSYEYKLTDEDKKAFTEYYYVSYQYTYIIPYNISTNWILGDYKELGESTEFMELVESCMKEISENELEEFDEVSWMSNTHNKKTGSIPLYLSQNHDIGYSEDEGKKDDNDKTLGDYERPSTKKEPIQTGSNTDDTPLDNPTDDNDVARSKDELNKSVNNYYYYTYNNSLNRNTGSFNKDNSDHSMNKRINSADYNKESSNPWDLPSADDFLEREYYTEGAGLVFMGVIGGLVGISCIYCAINSASSKRRLKLEVRKAISDVTGAKKNKIDPNKYLKEADSMVKTYISLKKNEWKSTYHKKGFELVGDPKVLWTLASDKQKPIEEWSISKGDKIVIIAEVARGLIKKDDAKKLADKYKKAEVGVCFVDVTDLPGDDNGGSWELFIDAGIVDGGPEDTFNLDEDKAVDYMDEQNSKIERSGYIEAKMYTIMNGIHYLEKYYKDREMTEGTNFFSEEVVDNDNYIFIVESDKMIQSDVKEYVDEHNVSAARDTLTGLAYVIDSFETFKISAEYAIEKLGKDIFEEDDGKEFTKEKTEKNYKYIASLMLNNFSEKKYKAAIEIGSSVFLKHTKNPNSQISKPSKKAKKSDNIVEDYIRDNGKIHRAGIVYDIRNGILEKSDIDVLVKDERIRSEFFGKPDKFKEYVVDKKQWTKEYLDKLILASVAECFNEDYLYYLYEVATYVRHIRINRIKEMFARKMNDKEFSDAVNGKTPEDIKSDIDGIKETIDAVNSDPKGSEEKRTLLGNLRYNLMRLLKYLKEKLKSLGRSMHLIESALVDIEYVLTEEQVSSIYEYFGDVILESSTNNVEDRPESDHPIRDTLMDVDRKLTQHQQKAKQRVQNIQNAGRAFMKPINRTSQWVDNMISSWKDAKENDIKDKLADPHARNNLFNAIKWAIKTGSVAKAGLLFNPVFLFLTVTRGVTSNKKIERLRHEMIGEIKTEREILKEKIADAERDGNRKAKYQLMRLDNELHKKLLRVGGGKNWHKTI